MWHHEARGPAFCRDGGGNWAAEDTRAGSRVPGADREGLPGILVPGAGGPGGGHAAWIGHAQEAPGLVPRSCGTFVPQGFVEGCRCGPTVSFYSGREGRERSKDISELAVPLVCGEGASVNVQV